MKTKLFDTPHYSSLTERLQIVIINLACIFDGLVAVVTLGTVLTQIRLWLLFEVFDDVEA